MSLAIKPADFRVRPGRRIALDALPTRVRNFYDTEDEAKLYLHEQVARTSELQHVLYASGKHALLVIFQAMDAGGKDGAIKHLMSGVNPQGCHVANFKQPSDEELQHDFLWRAVRQLPARGRIGIFNRSYYEDVLVVRVHPELLARQGIDATADLGDLWQQRFESIRDFEQHLVRNGTRVIKFFLHISREEQRKRLLERIDHPEKHWKFDLADVRERQHWEAYMAAYGDCLAATSTRDCPWYVIPADDKRNARLVMSSIINDTLSGLDLAYPRVDKARRAALMACRELLEDHRLAGKPAGTPKRPGRR